MSQSELTCTIMEYAESDCNPYCCWSIGRDINRFEKFLKEVWIHIHVEYVQKAALLWTARTLRSVLGFLLPGSRTGEFLGIWLMPPFAEAIQSI